jgi:hypothetical protein
MTAISMSRQRFHDCYRASQELSSKISQEEVVHEQVWQKKIKVFKATKIPAQYFLVKLFSFSDLDRRYG